MVQSFLPPEVVLTSKLVKEFTVTVEQTHLDVTRVFIWTPDPTKYNQREYWELAANLEAEIERTGYFRDDCDGHAAVVRGRLLSSGQDARILVCTTETGEGHAVVECGFEISDCRFAYATTIDEVLRRGYKFLARSGPKPGDPWHVPVYTRAT